MQNLRFSIAAGETKVFVIAGRYLEIIEATGPVTLGLYDENGSQTDDAKDVLSGTYMEGAFSQFEIYSATAQTVELFLTSTRGGTRRQPGNVRVIDEITDAILSSAYQGPTAVTAFAVQQLVAPAANVNGMIMRMASCGGAAGAGGSTVVRITAAKSLPSAYFNPSQCYQLVENFSAVANDTGTTQRMNKRLPAGWGLYLIWQITTAAPATGPSGVVQYELQ